MIKRNNLIELFFSCGLILCQISPSLSEGDGRIVGGVPTEIASAPYLVQLRSDDLMFCSGTLVSEYYVISAAHCFGRKPYKFTVVGGATYRHNDNGSARSNVSAYIYPKKYTNVTYNMDIAIIKLKEPLIGDFIQPISMKCKAWKNNAVVKLFGWGKLQEEDKSVPVQLQTVNVTIVEHGWCKWLYVKQRNITDFMFCAAAKGKDACSGDSGGPAIVNNQFCGVVSWGRGCAQKSKPGVYTNLRKLSTFVKKAMEKLKEY